MSITRTNHRNALANFHRDPFQAVNAFFNEAMTGDWPMRLDIREEQDHFIVEADLPGFNHEDVDITVENGVLTLTAERKSEQNNEGRNYRVQERRYGKVSRSIRLSDEVNPESIDASLKNGVLTLTLAKAEAARPRKIEIRNA